jgi:glycosyltransferase involved in cell wall biosynthesis
VKTETSKNKRIAFMATLPPPSGGEANVTRTFFDSLPALGYELQLIDVGKRHPRFFPGKFSLYNLSRMFWHLGKLLASNITFHPAFVNLMFSYSAITKFALFTLISKAMGVRVIGQLHDPWINQEYEKSIGFRRKFIRWVFRLPDSWIVLGKGWKNFMIQASVSESKICVIPNAVKNEFVSLAECHQTPVESNQPVILFVGTVGYRKGIDMLLEALAEIVAEGIPFKVQIIGDGELPGEREKLMVQYQQKLKANSFVFYPHKEQQDLIDFYTHASIFVLPSRAENLPVAMLEAMACALPVVVSRVGAVEEVIRDGDNGLLVCPDCPDELKVALKILLCDPMLRRRLGQNAQQTILHNHMPSHVGIKMHYFLDQLAEMK